MIQMIGVILNDSINDSICIGNVNNDNVSQEMVIDSKSLTYQFVAKNRLRISVVLHESVSKSVSSEAVSQSIKILAFYSMLPIKY